MTVWLLLMAPQVGLEPTTRLYGRLALAMLPQLAPFFLPPSSSGRGRKRAPLEPQNRRFDVALVNINRSHTV